MNMMTVVAAGVIPLQDGLQLNTHCALRKVNNILDFLIDHSHPSEPLGPV